MKICFVTTGDITSLATMKRATGMANPLIELGYEVAIVAENNPNNLDRFALECPKVTALLFEKGGSKYEVKQKKQMIKDWNPDIVYVCTFGIRNWIHRLSVSSKAIWLVEHSELISAIPSKKRHLYRIIEDLSAFLFNGQIYASRYLEEVFSKGIKGFFTRRQPTLYSPYAYNKELSTNYNTQLLSSLQDKYRGRKVILYMGTLSINYGFMDIIKSAETIKKKREDFIVLIMGSGRHKELGKKYIEENDLSSVVEMLGYIPEDEVSTYFKLAGAFISPLFDTVQDKARCPSKLFMYIPFDKPVITCRIGEAKELFGELGYYYSSGDVEELSSLITKVLDDKGEYNGIDVDKHSWDYRTKEFDKWIKDNFRKSI